MQIFPGLLLCYSRCNYECTANLGSPQSAAVHFVLFFSLAVLTGFRLFTRVQKSRREQVKESYRVHEIFPLWLWYSCEMEKHAFFFFFFCGFQMEITSVLSSNIPFLFCQPPSTICLTSPCPSLTAVSPWMHHSLLGVQLIWTLPICTCFT